MVNDSLPATRQPLDANASNPTLELAQHELADNGHAGVAVVQAGDGGKMLAAIVPEDLSILLRDLFQRLQAIGGKAGRDHGKPFCPLFRELLDGLVGVRLQPLVIAEARLEGEQELRRIEPEPLA